MNRFITLLILILWSVVSAAQHPLTGTWEMVSIKGTNADGEPFFMDTTTRREIKVITPTHYMLIASEVQGDSLIFNRSYFGTVTIEGDRYIEKPLMSSHTIFDNVKADYRWKIEGDRFIQSGSVTRPDGKKVILEAMVFRRVKTAQRFDQNPAIGTWSQVSSTYTDFEGNKAMHTRRDATRIHIITPTHWMRISHRNKKFEHAIGGSYTIKEGRVMPVVEVSSAPFDMFSQINTTEVVKGEKLHVQGTMQRRDGKTMSWEDVFEKVK